MQAVESRLSRQWGMVVLVLGASVVSAFQVGKAPLALGAVQVDLGLGLATVSWLVSAFALIGALVGAPIGLVVDRIGARRILLGGLVLQAAGSALGALADSAALLLLTRALEGLGFLAVLVASPTLVVAIAAPSIRDRAVALWATFMPVGLTLVMLGAPLFGLLGWRGFWLLNAGLLAAYALFFAFMMRSEVLHNAPPRAVLADLKAAVAAPGPWGLAAIFTAFSGMYFAVFSFLPMIFDQRFGIGEELAGMLTAGAVAAGGVGNIACGLMLARGFRPSRLLVASFVTMAVGGFAILSESSPFFLVSALAVGMSFMAGLIPVVLMDSVPRFAPGPELAGITIGFATQGNSLGMLAGPALAAVLAAHAGWTSVAIFLAGLAIGAVLFIRLLFSPASNLRSSPQPDSLAKPG